METTTRLIAEFEMSFTTSVKHTASVKWNVTFESSNLHSTLTNLEQLKHNLHNNQPNPVHVGWEITLQNVEGIQAILNELLNRWKQHTHLPPPAKLYKFLDRLREMETLTPEQLIERTVNKLTKPKPSPKLSKKEQEQADIDSLIQRRVLNMLKNQN